MKKNTFYILLILITGCCKAPIIKTGNTFIGSWYVSQIDSVRNSFTSYRTISEYELKDTIDFFSDSLGGFTYGLYSLSRGITSFSWSHDRLYGRVYLSFENGTAEALIKRQLRDTIELYVWDYLGPFYIGSRVGYYMKLERLD